MMQMNSSLDYCTECWEELCLCSCAAGYGALECVAELDSELPEPRPDPLIGGLPPFDKRPKRKSLSL